MTERGSVGLQPGDFITGRSKLCGRPGQHHEISRQGGRLQRRRGLLLCYLLIVFLVGFPVMLAELVHQPGHPEDGGGPSALLDPRWRFAGIHRHRHLFIILSYCCEVGAETSVEIYAMAPTSAPGLAPMPATSPPSVPRPVGPCCRGLGFWCCAS